MPLHDFTCRACGSTSQVLLRRGDEAQCPACGSPEMTKLLSPFAIGGRTRAAASGPAASTAAASESAGPASGGHVCGGGCSHGPKPAKDRGGCATAAYADSLVKKYLD